VVGDIGDGCHLEQLQGIAFKAPGVGNLWIGKAQTNLSQVLTVLAFNPLNVQCEPHFLVSDRNSSNVAGFGSPEDDVLRAADGTSEFAGFVVDVENDLAADVFSSQIVIANDSPCVVEYTRGHGLPTEVLIEASLSWGPCPFFSSLKSKSIQFPDEPKRFRFSLLPSCPNLRSSAAKNSWFSLSSSDPNLRSSAFICGQKLLVFSFFIRSISAFICVHLRPKTLGFLFLHPVQICVHLRSSAAKNSWFSLSSSDPNLRSSAATHEFFSIATILATRAA